jgi:hypothetical protein
MHRIRSVGVMSLAKISGLIHAALGLLFIPFFLLMGLSLSLAGTKAQSSGQNLPAFFGPAFAIGMSIFMPIFYGIMGFVMGAIGALLYNLISRWVGGIEMEIRVSGVQPAVTPVRTLSTH